MCTFIYLQGFTVLKPLYYETAALVKNYEYAKAHHSASSAINYVSFLWGLPCKNNSSGYCSYWRVHHMLVFDFLFSIFCYLQKTKQIFILTDLSVLSERLIHLRQKQAKFVFFHCRSLLKSRSEADLFIYFVELLQVLFSECINSGFKLYCCVYLENKKINK